MRFQYGAVTVNATVPSVEDQQRNIKGGRRCARQACESYRASQASSSSSRNRWRATTRTPMCQVVLSECSTASDQLAS